MHKLQGFTLVELMITIGVLAILATLAVPSFATMLRKHHLESSAMELNMLLSQARTSAVTTRQEVKVHLNTSGSNTARDKYWLPKGQVSYRNTSLNTLVFKASGQLQNSDGSSLDTILTLCDRAQGSDLSMSLNISRFGTVHKIDKGTCA
jgi:type IV fimbrial biogenesis protein FimT